MKSNYFFLLLLLGSFTLANGQKEAEDLKKSPCQCYCSDLCGPRDLKDDDTPFYDEETGVCFCKQRDKDNYIPNGCNLKLNQDFENCCKKNQVFKQPAQLVVPVAQPIK